MQRIIKEEQDRVFGLKEGGDRHREKVRELAKRKLETRENLICAIERGDKDEEEKGQEREKDRKG